MKNLPVPNIPTNDVYYKRQLSFYMFNIHVLSTAESYFFTYDQTIAKKGADDVVSMLYHFCKNILPPEVRHLDIFCDSCAGQNKNYTLFRSLHHLVHDLDRFDTVQVTFPIRGHSYMECDKNMGLINTKVRIEQPSQWNEHVRTSRSKPSPFTVIECDRSLFKHWSKYFLTTSYKKKASFQTRPIIEILFEKQHPRTVQLRESYSGSWESHIILDKKKKKTSVGQNRNREAEEPELLYEGPIPIPKKKFDNIMFLSRFCGPEAKLFYQNLKIVDQDNDEDDEDVFLEDAN
nr:uncharacterized protein LOC111422745 [Onthophagus taurus]